MWVETRTHAHARARARTHTPARTRTHAHTYRLILTVPLAFFLESNMMYKIAIGISGVWWLVFSLYTFKHLRARPVTTPPIHFLFLVDSRALVGCTDPP